MAKNDWASGMVQGISDSIKQYGDIQAERTKIMSALVANKLQAEQNWFYKQKEMQTTQDMQDARQKKNMDWWQQNYGGANGQVGEDESWYTQPDVKITAEGDMSISPPSPEKMRLAQLKAMKRKNMLSDENKAELERLENKLIGRLNTTRDLSQANFASGLRKEFIDRPEVKEFVTINTQVKSMDSLLNKAIEGNKQNQLSLDQALITMFNKLTDPQSVVRESEYARTPENLPFLNRFSGAFEKLQKGGAGITNEDRKALVWGAKVIANERGKIFNERRTEYVDLAGMYKVDPELVTGTIQPYQEYPVTETINENNVLALPKGTKTLSQAMSYLESQGMTSEQAVEWINSQRSQ